MPAFPSQMSLGGAVGPPIGPEPEVDIMGTGTPQPQSDPVGLLDQWRSWMSKPENRAGLMQMGLQMMQPINPGQTPFGHMAGAVGTGFEAHDRQLQEQEQEKRRTENFGLAEREVAARETAAEKSGGISLNTLFRNQQSEGKDYAKFVQDEAKSISGQANDLLVGTNNPYPQYKGMSEQQIRDEILKDPGTRQKYTQLRGGGVAPAAEPSAASSTPGASIKLEQFITAKPNEWAKFKAAINSSDPEVKQRAAGWAAKLRASVADPETLDEMLRE